MGRERASRPLPARTTPSSRPHGDDSVAGNNAWVKFEIVDRSTEGAYVCEGKDANDKTIEYTGKVMRFGLWRA